MHKGKFICTTCNKQQMHIACIPDDLCMTYVYDTRISHMHETRTTHVYDIS